ncbi:MAG: hypothetical protein V3R64_06145 [Sphingomonadales bacterium]
MKKINYKKPILQPLFVIFFIWAVWEFGQWFIVSYEGEITGIILLWLICLFLAGVGSHVIEKIRVEGSGVSEFLTSRKNPPPMLSLERIFRFLGMLLFVVFSLWGIWEFVFWLGFLLEDKVVFAMLFMATFFYYIFFISGRS